MLHLILSKSIPYPTEYLIMCHILSSYEILHIIHKHLFSICLTSLEISAHFGHGFVPFCSLPNPQSLIRVLPLCITQEPTFPSYALLESVWHGMIAHFSYQVQKSYLNIKPTHLL